MIVKNTKVFMSNLKENCNINYTERFGNGSHVPFQSDIYSTLQFGIYNGMESIQFFIGSPTSFRKVSISPDDILKTKRLLERFPTFMFSHTKYIYNLAGNKNICAWTGNDEVDNKLLNCLQNLEYELSVMSNFKDNGVIIHPGCHIDREKGLKAISTSINQINFSKNSKLLLENSSGGGSSLATTFEEIKMIIDNIDDDKKQNIGVCIDTCHLHSYGSHDLSKCEGVEQMFKDFDKVIGLDKLNLIHLNDSKTPFSSKKDRHELIMEGSIWKNNIKPLRLLLDTCNSRKIPIILETDYSDMNTLVNI